MSKHGEQYLAERAKAARTARDFLQSVSSKHAAMFAADDPLPQTADDNPTPQEPVEEPTDTKPTDDA